MFLNYWIKISVTLPWSILSTRYINHLHHNTPMANPEWVNKILELMDEAKNKKEDENNDKSK